MLYGPSCSRSRVAMNCMKGRAGCSGGTDDCVASARPYAKASRYGGRFRPVALVNSPMLPPRIVLANGTNESSAQMVMQSQPDAQIPRALPMVPVQRPKRCIRLMVHGATPEKPLRGVVRLYFSPNARPKGSAPALCSRGTAPTAGPKRRARRRRYPGET